MELIKDSLGSEWKLQITTRVVTQVLKPIGLNLLDPENCAVKLDQILESITDCMDVVWRLVEDQVKAVDQLVDQAASEGCDLSDVFWDRFEPAQLREATEALGKELLFFIHELKPGTIPLIKATIKKNSKVRQKQMEKLMELFQSEEVDKIASKELDRRMKEGLAQIERTLKSQSIASPECSG